MIGMALTFFLTLLGFGVVIVLALIALFWGIDWLAEKGFNLF